MQEINLEKYFALLGDIYQYESASMNYRPDDELSRYVRSDGAPGDMFKKAVYSGFSAGGEVRLLFRKNSTVSAAQGISTAPSTPNSRSPA